MCATYLRQGKSHCPTAKQISERILHEKFALFCKSKNLTWKLWKAELITFSYRRINWLFFSKITRRKRFLGKIIPAVKAGQRRCDRLPQKGAENAKSNRHSAVYQSGNSTGYFTQHAEKSLPTPEFPPISRNNSPAMRHKFLTIPITFKEIRIGSLLKYIQMRAFPQHLRNIERALIPWLRMLWTEKSTWLSQKCKSVRSKYGWQLDNYPKIERTSCGMFLWKRKYLTFDSKGELLITIMSSLAQEESRSISENVTWGQRKRFADGKVSLPYAHFLGYRKAKMVCRKLFRRRRKSFDTFISDSLTV